MDDTADRVQSQVNESIHSYSETDNKTVHDFATEIKTNTNECEAVEEENETCSSSTLQSSNIESGHDDVSMEDSSVANSRPIHGQKRRLRGKNRGLKKAELDIAKERNISGSEFEVSNIQLLEILPVDNKDNEDSNTDSPRGTKEKTYRQTRSSGALEMKQDVDDEAETSLRASGYAVASLRRILFEQGSIVQDGPITLRRLGRIRFDNPAFWTTKNIYPLGFETRAIVDGITWSCSIINDTDEANGPVFLVALESDPSISFQSSSPKKAWAKAMNFLASCSPEDKENWSIHVSDDSTMDSLSKNEDGFGFSRESICCVVEGLEDALKCTGYLLWAERHGTTLDKLAKVHAKLTKKLAKGRQTTSTKRSEPMPTVSIHDKTEQLRHRRQKRKHKGSSNDLKGKELLKFVEVEQQRRREHASTSAQYQAATSVFSKVKKTLEDRKRQLEAPSAIQDTGKPSWSIVPGLDMFPIELQKDVLWCWDFLFHFADVLRFRTMLPLVHFCQTIALEDKTAPQGDTIVNDDKCHGRLLATLHIVILESLLVEYTPYLQMSVEEFKKVRPLNFLTWPEVARQMFMIAWDVEKGEADGNSIKLLKGAKSSTDSTILALREEMTKQGEAILTKTPLKTTITVPPSVDPMTKIDNGYSLIVDIDSWVDLGLEFDSIDGIRRVVKVTDDCPTVVKERVQSMDILVCVNGVDVTVLDQSDFDKLVSGIESPLGMLFIHGELPIHSRSKASSQPLMRCAYVLKILRAKEAAIPFNAPVDAAMYPDYYTIISEPMDLNTVEERVLNDEYEDVESFLDDVQLIWKNCYEYNGEQAQISVMARRLSAVFDRLVDNYVQGEHIFKDEEACRSCRNSICRTTLLVCDHCEGAFHTACIRPPLQEIPDGEWYCMSCVPLQPETQENSKLENEVDESGGLPHLIRLLSRESYMELTVDERVVVFKGLCELVQTCSIVQSILSIVEDIAEDQRSQLDISFSDVFREWTKFGPTVNETPSIESSPKVTESLDLGGKTYPLTDSTLVYLKERALAEIRNLPLPLEPGETCDEFLLKKEVERNVDEERVEDLNRGTEEESKIPRDNGNNSTFSQTSDQLEIMEDEMMLLEKYSDIQLATRVSSIKDPPLCYCCEMNAGPLGDVSPGIIAPLSKNIVVDVTSPPQVAFEPLTIMQLPNVDSAQPFKCDVDDEGRVTVTEAEEDCAIAVGDYILALNTKILDGINSIEDFDKTMQEQPRPLVVLACSPWANFDRDQLRLVQLPHAQNFDCPSVSFPTSELPLCQVKAPVVGSLEICGAIFPNDIIFALNGHRITSDSELQENWQPGAIMHILCHKFNRVLKESNAEQKSGNPSQPQEIVQSILQQKSFDMIFNAGPLGLALELDKHVVAVRSLTTVSQAINTVKPGDIILSLNGQLVGPLDELNQFTEVVRTMPRPAKFRFYRPTAPISPPSEASIIVSVDELKAMHFVFFEGRIIVGTTSNSLDSGDTITHINGVSIAAMDLPWLQKLLATLPGYDRLYLCILRRPPPDELIRAHSTCADLWNIAIQRGTELQEKIVRSKQLETSLREIAPRTIPFGSYYRFRGDPGLLYKEEKDQWWQTNDIKRVISVETNISVADAIRTTLLTGPNLPKSGPFSLRPIYGITPSNQHEAYMMLYGRQYYLGSYPSATEAELAFQQSKERYLKSQNILAPYSSGLFPKIHLPILKADELLKHIKTNPKCSKLTAEMKDLARYSIRAVKPKAPSITVSIPQYSTDGAIPDKLMDHLSKRSNAHSYYQRLVQMKALIRQAWSQVQIRQTEANCQQFTLMLQSALTAMNAFAHHISKNPMDIETPATFVSLHHAIVVCLLSILLSESLGETPSMILPDLQLMHKFGDNLLWAIDSTLKPEFHARVMTKFMELAKVLTELTNGLTPAVATMVKTVDTFLKTSCYLMEPVSYQQCRPLFAMLNETSALRNRQIQPLPPALTQELWKLQTCQGLYEKALRKQKIPWPPNSVLPNATHVPIPKSNPPALAPLPPTPSTEPPKSNVDTIVRFNPGPLGIIIQQDEATITVSAFAAGDDGQAIKSGKIAIGDLIVAVNGEPISKIGIEGFKQAVTKGPRPLHITFRRRGEPHPKQKLIRPPIQVNTKEKPPRKRAKVNLSSSPTSGSTNSTSVDSSMNPGTPSNFLLKEHSNLHESLSNSMAGSIPNSTTATGLFTNALMDPNMDIDAFNSLTSGQNLLQNQVMNSFDGCNVNPTAWNQQPGVLDQNANMLYASLYGQGVQENLLASAFTGFEAMLAPQNNSNTTSQQSEGTMQSSDFQAYFDAQFYNPPPSFRSGSDIEFVDPRSFQIQTDEDDTPAPSPLSSPQQNQQLSSKPPTPMSESNSVDDEAMNQPGKREPPVKPTDTTIPSGRRSSRVSKRPEQMQLNSIPKTIQAKYIPGAGQQGEFSTDMLIDTFHETKSSFLFTILQAQLIAIEAALPREAFRHNKWNQSIRTGWANYVMNGTISRHLLEAMIVLENHIELDYLDSIWKSYSMISIKTTLERATIASVAIRLIGLDDALSYTKPLKKQIKRKNITTRRQEIENQLPPLPHLHDEQIYKLVVQKIQNSPHEICYKTLSEITGLTHLPVLILEKWYKQCIDLNPKLKMELNNGMEENNISVIKRNKTIKNRKLKQLEYKYEKKYKKILNLNDPMIYERFLYLFEILSKNSISYPFLYPVDIPEYKKKIKKPMNLYKIINNLKNGKYFKKIYNILYDMKLIWTNCFLYNSIYSDISYTARRFRSVFYRLVDEWIQNQPFGTPQNVLLDEESCRLCKLDGENEKVMLCDSCDGAYHASCVGMKNIPSGNWYCMHCIENRDLL